MATAPATSAIDIFFDQVRSASQRILMLDYDGTLAPFTANRHRALPYGSIAELLDAINSTCRTRVVIISGRPALEVTSLLDVHFHPEIWGVHGLERLSPSGRREFAFVDPVSLQAITDATVSLEEAGLSENCEFKRCSIAVHWRGLRGFELEDVRTQAYMLLGPVACKGNLLLAEFDGGVELKPKAARKSTAVRTILSEAECSVPAAYLGDDLTDEDAFEAIDGRGLSILVRSEWRPSRAQAWLRPPEQLVQFLSEWVHCCGGDV
jgi:trehalose 6-phosphate phosphatase